MNLDDRSFAFVCTDPLTDALQHERANRNSKALWQCTCEIGLPFLKPCGQNLRMLSGGKCPENVQMLPLSLMSEEQRDVYAKIDGVDCWWCSHGFEGRPVGCPVKLVQIQRELDAPIVRERVAWCTEPKYNSRGVCVRCKTVHKRPRPVMRMKALKYKHKHKLNSLVPIHMRKDYEWTQYATPGEVSAVEESKHGFVPTSRKRVAKPYTLKGGTASCKPTRPVKYMKKVEQTHESVDGFYLQGYFCGWACARAYGELHSPQLRNEIGSWIYKFVINAVNQCKREDKEDRDRGLEPRHGIPETYRAKPVPAAPHFSLLRSKGGPMTIDEFRRVHERHNQEQLTVTNPMRNVIPCGMMVAATPQRRSFSARYNQQMGEMAMKRRPRYKTRSLVLHKKRAKRNAIMSTIRKEVVLNE